MSVPGIPQHPNEYVMVWCTVRKAYLKVISHRCDICHELVDISNPANYYLERYLGNSEYGYQIQHIAAHCPAIPAGPIALDTCGCQIGCSKCITALPPIE